MPEQMRKEDLRVLKTHRALRAALAELLERRGFARVTINDLCEEAQISRATFYAHFRDKYDLLEHCLCRLSDELSLRRGEYGKTEAAVNDFACTHKRIITNLLKDANEETFDLLHKFLISLLDISQHMGEDERQSERYTVLSTFCAGGLYNLLLWHVRHKFPQETRLFNEHVYELVNQLLDGKYGAGEEGA